MSQNTTIEQMKMFLTRIGFNSKAVITGDVTQIDLPRNTKSGLRHAIEVLADVEEISFNFFHSETWFVTLWWRVSLTPMKPGKKPNKNEKRRWQQNASAKNRNKNESGDPRFTTGM